MQDPAFPDETDSGNPPPWLQDVDRAAQHLARLSLETDAQAALITRDAQLWAYAGELSQSALDELAIAVAADPDGLNSGDRARFIRLRETGGEYMLYSTRLGDELVLSLAFDAATRFSEIRTQAFGLVRALSTIPNGEALAEAEVLDEASTTPDGPREFLAEEPRAEYLEDENPDPPTDDGAGEGSALDAYLSGENQVSTESLFLDPVSPAIHNLSFACVLIPRLPLHRLLGDLKEELEQWMPQICLSYGWRLSDLAVHPDRMLWVVNMPPDYSPGFMLETIRMMTSAEIFEHNPRLKKENHSDDFWAPGFMVLASARLPADEPVAKYIRRTRSWQGYR